MKTFSLTFFIKKDKTNSKGVTPVYGIIRAGGGSATFSTNYHVNPERWRLTNQFSDKKKSKGINEATIADGLAQIKTKLWEISRELEMQDEPITATAMKNKYLNKLDIRKLKTVEDAFKLRSEKLELRIQKGDYSKNTYKKFKTVRKYVSTFLTDKYGAKHVYLKEIKEEIAEEFFTYLRHQKRIVHTNTANKYIRIFKSTLKEAVLAGWIKTNPLAKVVTVNEEENVEGLTTEEVVKIANHKLDDPLLEKAQTFFIFCCCTGLAFCDAQKLKMTELIDINGKIFIKGRRKKSKSKFNVPLFAPAKAIIEKYQGDPARINDNYVLPRFNLNHMNRLLKIIGLHVGLNRSITTHIARHSFGCMLADMKVDPEVAKELMGHKNLGTTFRYYKVRERRILEDTVHVNSFMEASFSS